MTEVTNAAGVHAITSGGGYSYQYDDYGNMTQRGNDTVVYDVFNKPVQIEDTHFAYGADYELLTQLSYETNTQTFYLYGLYGEKFEAIANVNGLQDYRHYVGGAMLYETDNINSPAKTSYLHYDHLGSAETITDGSGNVRDYLSYNAWGERRNDDWSSGDPTMGLPYFYDTQTGFTGHETLDHLGLIHMGGRVYDPVVSRFMSADFFVQEPYSSQSFNRYSYVFNNPLSYTDPTGYSGDKDKYDDLLMDYPDDYGLGDSCEGRCSFETEGNIGTLIHPTGERPITRSSTSVSFTSPGYETGNYGAGAGSAPSVGSAGSATKKIYQEHLNLVGANAIFNANNHKNLIVVTNADLLTVQRTSELDARVLGADFLVHGRVTLDVDNAGNVIGIESELYDFDLRDDRSKLGNFQTMLGAGAAEAMRQSLNYNGMMPMMPRQRGVPFTIEYMGAPHVK